MNLKMLPLSIWKKGKSSLNFAQRQPIYEGWYYDKIGWYKLGKDCWVVTKYGVRVDDGELFDNRIRTMNMKSSSDYELAELRRKVESGVYTIDEFRQFELINRANAKYTVNSIHTRDHPYDSYVWR